MDLRLTATRLSVLHAAGFALFCGAAASLTGCAESSRIFGLSSPPVDADSPIAKDVIYASQHPGPYPTFSDIPKTPTDVRPVSAWKAAVTNLQDRKAMLEARAAQLPPAPNDTEAFAAAQRSRAVAPPPVSESSGQQTEAEAKALRERATPPPSSR